MESVMERAAQTVDFREDRMYAVFADYETFRRQPGSLEPDILEIPCRIVRTSRKTMALQIEEDGQVTVRVPRTATEAQAEEFARRHGEWILKTREKVLQNASWRRSYTEAEKQTGKQRLNRKLEERRPCLLP